jgi:hypothetical protein
MEVKDHSPTGRKFGSSDPGAHAFLCGNWPKKRGRSAVVACFVCGLLLLSVTVGVNPGKSAGHDLQMSHLLLPGLAFIGIILATWISMHRFVQGNFGEVDLIQAARSAGILAFFRRATLCPAMASLQGGRWTKDWCGGDQDWRTRLSGRGWTDRRRSG